MSYCRFSTNNHKCDLYIYESDSGYCIHVASRKYANDLPPYPNIKLLWYGGKSKKRWIRKYKQYRKAKKATKLVDIGLEYDGHNFILSSAKEVYEHLMVLKAAGYRFPDYLFNDFQEQQP